MAESLCHRCRTIDFDTILSEQQAPPRYERDYRSQDVIECLGPVENWKDELCVLCKALINLIPPGFRANPSEKYCLRSFPSENSPWIQYYYPLLSDIPPRMLFEMTDQSHADHDAHLLVPQSAAKIVRVLNPAAVDYDVLRGWLSVCKSMHTKSCFSGNRRTVEYLKFLDCETRKLVPAGNLPYVTLSYMWGGNERPPLYNEQLGPNLPPTIEDAITVTLKLGYRYLWIDRYCINQQNREQAISQIQQMDAIYQDSEVTVVAAAGIGPTYGLPGVSRPRTTQPVAQIGETQFISPGSVPRKVLEGSRWSTRGWTFQEAYLSRRRLTFTDEQVYYECGGLYSYESIDVPLSTMHTEDGQTLESKYFNNLDGKIVVFPGGVGHEPLHIFDRITDFSVKSLTYTSDKLNGFLGIAKTFETGPHRIRNLWGSPILPKDGEYHVTELLSSMCWVYGDAKRIPSLPSWSWVGWDGDLYFSYMGDFHGLGQIPPATVSVELKDAKILDWKSFHENYGEVNSLNNITQSVHISAWTVPIHITKRKGQTCHSKLAMSDGCYLSFKFDAHDARFQGETCIGLLTVENRDPSMNRMAFLLVVGEVEGEMERVGGSWLLLDCVLFDGDGESVLRKGAKYGDQFIKWEDLVERYGETWYTHLVSNYQTTRIG